MTGLTRMRDLRSAVDYAKQQVNKDAMHGMCQSLSRTTIGVPPFGVSASIAFESSRDRGWAVPVHPGTVIPAGSIVYYSKNANFKGHDPTVGHATFCVMSGTPATAIVVSNDVGPHREIGAVRPHWFNEHWHMTVRGYIVNCPYGPLPIDSAVPAPHPEIVDTFVPDDPTGVLLSNLKPGSNHPDVKVLQKALIAHGYPIEAGPAGFYKEQTVAAVKAAQEAQGFTGANADGAIGRRTCLFLGLNVLG
jgi:hypothetical protein